MKIFGHRGAAGLAPENTLASIGAALQVGVDGIEFDVRCARDHVPVLIHDELVDRTTNGSGAVADYSLARLQELRIAETERIPTLAQAIQLIGRQTQINVELKESAACRPTASVIRLACQDGTISPDQVLVSSFDQPTIEDFCRLKPGVGVGLLTKDLPEESFWALAKELKAQSANIALPAVTREFVHRAQDAGLQVMVYTVNSRRDMLRLEQLGVDAIFSDFPDRFCR